MNGRLWISKSLGLVSHKQAGLSGAAGTSQMCIRDRAVTGSLQRCLADGEVDLLLGNYSDLREDFYIAAAFDSQEHYIVTTLDNPEVLAGLNLALERIYDANPNYARERYQENFVENANGYARLNDTEKKYIAEKQAVTVAVPEDWHPMYCLNNIDGHNGLVVDILNEIKMCIRDRFHTHPPSC